MSSHQTQFRKAQDYIQQRKFDNALAELRSLLNHTHIIDYEYQEWMNQTAEVYEKHLNDPLAAAYVLLAAGHSQMHTAAAPIRRCLDRVDAPIVRAKSLEAQKQYSEAARIYLQQGRFAHAAVNHEQAKEFGPARAAWETLLSRQVLQQRSYLLALVHLNLSLCCQHLNDKKAHHEHLVITTRLLEEAADDYETKGDREMTFYCYQVMLKLGKEVNSYENIAEGYLNSIRVLKGDNLKSYVLQYYEEFQRLSMEREEFHAAATLYREAAEYCARVGLPYAKYYESKSGEAWSQAAESNEKRGGPPELSENALLAAIDAFNQVGDQLRVKTSYERLVGLSLSDKRKKRYQDLLSRFQNITQEASGLTAFREQMRQTGGTALWYVDILEWEQDGDPLEVALSMVWNPDYHEVARRRALKLLLLIHDERRSGAESPAGLCRIAEALGEIQVYAVLAPLEKLAAHPEASVRAKAVGASQNLYFKRSFNLVRKGLGDTPEIKERAMEALGALHFPHAFEPISRIYREQENPRVRKTAIKSIGRISSEDAAEFLLEVFRYETGDLKRAAEEALRSSENRKLHELIEKQIVLETGEMKRSLQAISDAIRAGRRNLYS
jgi:HEAT repeats